MILMDSSFVQMLLSAFLGFGSALLVEALVERIRNKKQKAQLLADLQKELQTINNCLSSIEDDKVYIQPYSIPIWSGARQCGLLLCMDGCSFFPELLDVFSSIEEANLIEMKCFELFIGDHSTKEVSIILSTLEECRNRVRKQVEVGLKLIKEEMK